MTPLSRRELLAAGASGAALALAGCNALGDEEETYDEPVTIATQPPESDALDVQQEFQLTQQEVQQRVQAGDLNQTEAQQELQDAQEGVQEELEELQAEAVSTVEEHVAEVEELTVSETLPEAGALLVEGDSDAALELLELDAVVGILPAEDFEDYRDQQDAGVQ